MSGMKPIPEESKLQAEGPKSSFPDFVDDPRLGPAR
jgi:hypothetical protein